MPRQQQGEGPTVKAECFLCLVCRVRLSSKTAGQQPPCSYGGQVHAVGRMTALIPGAELGGHCAWPGPVHLRITNE